MLPIIVAGPVSTVKVTAPLEAEVAITANGEAPSAWVGIGVNVRTGTPYALTVSDTVAATVV
jgi:hypothetical protein